MLRFDTYFCCLLNCYFIFCSYVLPSVLNSHLTKNRAKTSCCKGGESENPVDFKDNRSDRKRTGIKKGATPCSNLC